MIDGLVIVFNYQKAFMSVIPNREGAGQRFAESL